MRIDAYAQVQQVYGSKQSHKMQQESRTSFKDRLEISSKGKDIQAAKNALEAAPDIREDKVSSIKSAIHAGTYQVSSGQFAQKIFEKYNSTHLGSF